MENWDLEFLHFQMMTWQVYQLGLSHVPVGVVLTQLVATDPDERPIIRYWIDHAGKSPVFGSTIMTMKSFSTEI